MATKKAKFVTINGINWTPELVRQKIATTDKGVKAALMRLYQWQTEDEKADGQTKEYNNLGFNGVDSEFLTSLAQQLETKQFLSPKQITCARKKLLKYSRQIFDNHILAQREEVYNKFGL